MGKTRIRVAIVLLMLLFGMLNNIEIALAVSWTHLSSADGDIPTPGSGNEQTASLVFDFDKDGDNDFLMTDRSSGPAITLYRQSGTGWTKYIVDNTENLHIEAGGAYFDIDKDGDLDILMAGDWASNQVWWWENPYPNYDPSVSWKRYTIKNNGLSYQHDQAFGDFDGDGKTELAWWGRSSSDSSLYVAEIPSNPKNAGLWAYSVVNTINPITAKSYPREGMKAIDIDLDGKLDILGGGGWFKSAGSSYTFQSIEIERSGVESRADAGQLIPGGRPEVVFSAGDFEGILAWYEWNGNTWVKHILKSNVDHGHSLQIADINNDGNLDIFCAEMRLNSGNPDSKMWIFYGDGKGSFTEELVAEGIGNHESRVADLDDDGDMDLFGKPYNWEAPRVDIWLQQNEPIGLDNWEYVEVDKDRAKYSVSWYEYFGIFMDDANGDGFDDIVSGKYFYKNPGGSMTVWPSYTFPVDADSALIVNVDADQNADVIAFALPDVYWFESTNADATSWAQRRKITLASNTMTEHKNPQGWRLADLTGNGRQEILFEAGNLDSAGVYALQIPANPLVDAWQLTKLTPSGGDGIGVGDIDNDGDIDITIGQKNVKWYENPGSLGMWAGYNVGDTDISADRFAIEDIDGDGKNDIIVSEETWPNADDYPTKCYWFKNPGNPKSGSWIRNYVASGYYGLQSMEPVDMDNDGDIDVVLGEHKTPNRVLIFENDGSGHFTEHEIGRGKESHGLYIEDIDHDGDKDIAHIGWTDYSKLHLWINQNSKEGTDIDTGIIYKEFSYTNTVNNWRVTDPLATSPCYVNGVKVGCPQDFLPNPTLTLSGVDVESAIKAELIIDFWGGHDGTTGKKFRFNSNSWIDIPELGSIPAPKNMYMQQVNHVVPVPINDLKTGANTLEGISGPNGWGWGQWGWYGVILRIYYDKDKPHATGSIAYPKSASTITDNPTISVSAPGATKVDVLAYYDDYDIDGNGIYQEWQNNYHRQSWSEPITLKNYVGSDIASPFQIKWDTLWVPDQAQGSIKLKARIQDSNGYWYETAVVDNINLQRNDYSVKLYKSYNVPQKFWVRAGETKYSNINIATLSGATEAKLLVKTWDGNDGSDLFSTKVNAWQTPKYGNNHFYSYDQLNIPLTNLKKDLNTITFYSSTAEHGIEIMWPGPAIAVKYGEYVDLCGNKNCDAGENCVSCPGDCLECTETQENFIKNPGFESGTTSWNFFTDGTGTFTSTSPGFESSNSAKVSISSVGANIQLYQYDIPLQPTIEYELSFDAYSNTGHDLELYLQKHDSPYTSYGLSKQFDLTNSWKHFSTKFTTSGFSSPVTDARLRFWFSTTAQAGDEFIIDNVVLKQYVEGRIFLDKNGDGCVDTPELVSYLEEWKNSRVSMSEVIEAIGLWKHGCF